MGLRASLAFMRRTLSVLLLLPLAVTPVAAQTLRSVAVPADAGVVIPPRSQAAPASLPEAVPGGTFTNATPEPLASARPMGLAAGAVGIVLPLAAAALLGAGLPGGGGASASGGAPAVSR
jgi:hypothetical protein